MSRVEDDRWTEERLTTRRGDERNVEANRIIFAKTMADFRELAAEKRMTVDGFIRLRKRLFRERFGIEI